MNNVDEKVYDFNDEAKKGIALAMHAINGVLNEEIVEQTYTTQTEADCADAKNVKNVSDIKITFDMGKCYTSAHYSLKIPDSFSLERDEDGGCVAYLRPSEDESVSYSITIYPQETVPAELSFDYHIPELYSTGCEVIYWTVLKRALKPVLGHSAYHPLFLEHACGGCCYGLSGDVDLASHYYVSFYNGSLYQMFHVVVDKIDGSKEDMLALLEQVFAGFVPEEEIVPFIPLSDDRYAAKILTREDVDAWLGEIRKRKEEFTDLLSVRCTLEEKARIPYEVLSGKLSDEATKERFASYVRLHEEKRDQVLMEMAEYVEKVRSLNQDEDVMFYLYTKLQELLIEYDATVVMLNGEEIRSESQILEEVTGKIFSGDIKEKFEERLKEERERKEREEREKREAERKARIEAEMVQWRAEVEKIKQQREDARLETFRKIDIDEKQEHDRIQQEKQPAVDKFNEEKDGIWAEIEEKKMLLSGLGFLDGAKKKEIVQGIEGLEKRLLEVDAQIFEIESKAEEENQAIRNKAFHDRENLEELLAQKFPYPESPEVIEERRLAEEAGR